MNQEADPKKAPTSGPLDRALIDLSPDSVYVHQDEKVVFANASMLRLVGAAQESGLIGRSIWDFIHPSFQSIIRDRIRKVQEEGVTVPLLEQQIITLDGSVVDVEATARAISYGGRQGFLVVVRDISERKRSQDELRQSESRYRAIFENAVEGIFQSNPAGTYIHVNPAYARMFGYTSPQEMLESVSDIAQQIYIDPKGREGFLAMMSENDEVHGHEVQLRRRDGQPIWVRENLKCVRDREGNVVYYQGMVEDISGNRSASDRLRQAEERFSKAFHASPDGMTISTLEDGRYVDVNLEYSRLIGYERSELIGKTSLDLGIWSNSRTRDDLIRAVEEHGFVKSFSVEMKTKSGKLKQVEMSADRIHLNGVAHLLAILRDVTESKMMEQQLRHAQKMQAVGQLAGGIAHDFNNTLMIIDSYTDLASAAQEDPAMQATYLEEIRRASNRAAQLTAQLLAFSRKQPVVKETVDVGHFLTSASDAWQRMLGEKIRLHLTLAQHPVCCSISVTQLESALLNVLLNARDAMSFGGDVFIQAREISIKELQVVSTGSLPEGDYACIEIRDTGEGIAPEHFDRLFEPFFTTKAKGVGTGLGLASVYGIVAQSDGFIDISSELGVGTRFSLFFPATGASVPKNDIVAPEAPHAASQRILLVEDNKALLDALTDWLDAKGFEVVGASTGEEALRRSEAQSIDILISDVVMPGMGGNELYRIFHAKYPTVRTILMSGYQDDAVVSADGVIYLAKPFTFAQLSDALKRLNAQT